ncbi:phage tail tape measure protein [Streptomyces griseoviridis]
MAERTVRVRVVAQLSGFGALRGAAGQVAGFGRMAAGAAGGVRGLTTASAGARRGLAGVGAGARGGAAGLRDTTAAAGAARRGLAGVTTAGATVPGLFGRIGASARSGMSRAAQATSSLLAPVRGLGTMLAGGAIIYGLADIVHQGNEYSSALLKFGEVTRASGAEMKAAGREAQALGADVRLPAATAAEAADAMVELAKAGLSATDSMRAARGTLQLSAAARTDVAMAARIEGDIMDQFAMKGSQATIVADTLANTVNNSSGELIDLYYAMKYVGPTAHSMGVSIQETATAVGLLGKSGIIGETAGTTLRGMLARMAAPTRQAKKGLRELGIEAFDSAGKFKGLEYVVGKLADAHHHLTQKEFTSAAAMAFGKPALSGATALAHQGAEAYQTLAKQIGRAGGAADVAAAESKGLGGAMRTLGAQIRGAFLQVYLGVSPVLEKITRGMATSVSSAIPYIKRGVKVAGTVWEVYGPTVERKLHAAGGRFKKEAAKMADPLISVFKTGLAAAGPIAAGALYGVWVVLKNVGATVSPLVDGLAAVVGSVGSASGALSVLSGAGGTAIGVLSHVTDVLGPLAAGVGGLGVAFGGLPGPVQVAVLSMLALRLLRPQLDGLRGSVTAYGRAGVTAFRGIGDSALYQRVLAAGAGQELGRFGGYVAALEARSPAIRRMGDAFRSTAGDIRAAGGPAVGFRSALTGIGAAARSGAMSGLKGLVGFLGGGWGVAIAGAMVGLALLAKAQQEAAAATAAHKQRVSDLAGALAESNGQFNGSFRATVTQTLADAKLKDGKTALLDVTSRVGLSTRQVVDAYLGEGTSLSKLAKKYKDLALAKGDEAFSKGRGDPKREELLGQARAYAAASLALSGLNGEVPSAVSRQKDLADAAKGSGKAALDATNPTGRLKDAISTLADSTQDADTKTRALHSALNLLSGGELDVQAAVAQMNESIASLQDLGSNVDKSKGFGKNLEDMSKSLISVDGKLNTTTANGRDLFNRLQDLNSGAAGAAQSTYDLARANGEEAGPALAEAGQNMEVAWKAAVAAGREFGLTKTEAMELANSMGFIPSNLAITLDTPGLSQTEADLLYVQGLAGHMPADSTIRVSALTDEATTQLEGLGFKIRRLPGGRQVEITAPTDKAAAALDALIAKKLPAKQLPVSAETKAAIADLEALKEKVASTKGKTLTVEAPTKEARTELEKLGFKISSTKGKKVVITLPTSGPKAAAQAIQNYIDGVHGKVVGVGVYTTEYYKKVQSGGDFIPGISKKQADGSVLDFFASGGLREQHVAQIAPAGAMRVWAERETGGEAYLPLAPAKRGRSTRILEEVAKRFGYRLEKFANGGIRGVSSFADGGFTYTPTGRPVLGGPSDAKQRYDGEIEDLKKAWDDLNKALKDQKKAADSLRAAEKNLSKVRRGHHTAAQLRSAQERVDKARSAKKKADTTVKKERADVYAADKELGLKKGAKAPKSFSLKAYETQLNESVAATEKWRKSLTRIGARGGKELQAMLEGMDEDGYALVNALASASDKQFKSIVAKLQKTGDLAKATLADYTAQMNSATKAGGAFQANLLKLSAMGYGALAAQLASQGDEAAQTLAAAAVKDPRAAASATKAAQANASLLSGDDLTNAMTLLGVLRAKPGAGIADVIAAGLDWATIRALAPKIAKEIKSVRGSEYFVDQMRGQSVAMARGGILPDSSYTVLAGERGTGGEAYIPLGAGNRGRSTALLSSVAGNFGYSLTPVRAAGGGTVVHQVTNHRSVTLHGARQSSAEQAHDIVRHMDFIA